VATLEIVEAVDVFAQRQGSDVEACEVVGILRVSVRDRPIPDGYVESEYLSAPALQQKSRRPHNMKKLIAGLLVATRT